VNRVGFFYAHHERRVVTGAALPCAGGPPHPQSPSSPEQHQDLEPHDDGFHDMDNSGEFSPHGFGDSPNSTGNFSNSGDLSDRKRDIALPGPKTQKDPFDHHAAVKEHSPHKLDGLFASYVKINDLYPEQGSKKLLMSFWSKSLEN